MERRWWEKSGHVLDRRLRELALGGCLGFNVLGGSGFPLAGDGLGPDQGLVLVLDPTQRKGWDMGDGAGGVQSPTLPGQQGCALFHEIRCRTRLHD